MENQQVFRKELGLFDSTMLVVGSMIGSGIFIVSADMAIPGYPLTPERQDDGTVLYRFVTGYKNLPPITFSLQELMTLYLCRGQLGFLQGTPFQDDLDALFGRIRSSLPPRKASPMK